MVSLGSREKALENKFHHDENLAFKVYARRNRLFGLWAAYMMDFDPEDAETYARTLTNIDYCTRDGEKIVSKVWDDLSVHKMPMTQNTLKKQLIYCYQDALSQIVQE